MSVKTAKPLTQQFSKRLLAISALTIALGVGLPTVSSPVYAASTVDFSTLVEQVTPAVVRVNVYKKVSQEDIMQQQLPELLKRFFGNQIQIPNQRRTPVEQMAYGTAFFISSDGYLLTNNHVIADARKITITFNDRRELDATLVGTDERTDIAVLKVKLDSYPALKIGSSTALKVGEPVLAIGSPFGFDYSASAGIVSAKSRSMSAENAVPFIQTDVALNPGNSGGPLFNQKGEVVGINSRIFSGTGGYMGLSFSIPIDVAMDVADQLRNGGKVMRAYLGIYPQDIDRNLAEVYGLDRPEGALVTKVSPNSAASKAGILDGDIILNFNNQPISRAADLINLINRIRPETTVPLVVKRAGKTINLNATLKAAPKDDDDSAGNSNGKSANAQSGPDLGLQVRDITAEEKAEIKTQGVLIQAVAPNSLASRSGLMVGDVITRLNGADTPTVETLAKAIKKLPNNKVVGVWLVRQGTPMMVGVRIEPIESKK